jgi:hypothetical protein
MVILCACPDLRAAHWITALLRAQTDRMIRQMGLNGYLQQEETGARPEHIAFNCIHPAK